MLSSFTCAKNTGIATQAKYPYVAVTQQCQTKKFVPPIYKIPKAMSFTNSGREDLLMSYLKTYGPLAVIISLCGVLNDSSCFIVLTSHLQVPEALVFLITLLACFTMQSVQVAFLKLITQ